MISDAVQVAIIAAVPGSLAAMVGVINLFTLAKVKKNTDGKLANIESKLDDKSAAVLDLTGKASASQAVVDEHLRQEDRVDRKEHDAI